LYKHASRQAFSSIISTVSISNITKKIKLENSTWLGWLPVTSPKAKCRPWV